MTETEENAKYLISSFPDRLACQTWFYVLFMIIILASAWLTAIPLTTLHHNDHFKIISYIGGIGLSMLLFITSMKAKYTKSSRFGMLNFFVVLSLAVPAILLVVQIQFNIDRFIKPDIGKSVIYVFIGLLWISYLLSAFGLFLPRQKTDFLLSLTVFVLFSSQIALPIVFKNYLHSYSIKHRPCYAKLRELSKAYFFASEINKTVWIQKDHWCDILHQEWDVELRTFLCPDDPFGPCSYAMNENIPADVNDLPTDLVLLFESTPGWNQTGGPEDVVTNRHDKNDLGANFAFADGHVEFVSADKIQSLRWSIKVQPSVSGGK